MHLSSSLRKWPAYFLPLSFSFGYSFFGALIESVENSVEDTSVDADGSGVIEDGLILLGRLLPANRNCTNPKIPEQKARTATEKEEARLAESTIRDLSILFKILL